jgi:hypothetical protein
MRTGRARQGNEERGERERVKRLFPDRVPVC